MILPKKSGFVTARGCGVPVERDTPRLVPPHSTLKPFFENSIPASTPLVFQGGYSLILVPPGLYPGSVWSFSFSLSLSRRSEFGSTKSPLCAHAPCPANNDGETPRCASSSATGHTEREVSTCLVTLILTASPAAYRSHENKQSRRI